MPEIPDTTDNPLAALNRRIMDTCYHVRAERLISPATISDYVRQRLQDNPGQVVKLLIELDDTRAMLQSLAIMPDIDRTAAIKFHDFMENDSPFDENTDE